MHASADAPIADLAAAWQLVDHRSPAGTADPVVLDCARRLAADPGGERAAEWVYGLLSMTRYLATRADAATAGQVAEVLRTAARALEGPPCDHRTHPCESALEQIEFDELRLTGSAPDVVLLGNGTPTGADPAWQETGTKEEYRCPHAVAVFARIAAEIIAPGTPQGIPERVPHHYEDSIEDLASVLHGYPRGGVEPAYEITAGTGLPTHPTTGALAGHLVLLRAGCWEAASGTIRPRWVLDDMIGTLEDALRALEGATCSHGDGAHPELSGDPDTDAGTGYHLLTPGGRARLQRSHEDGIEDAPPAAWTCRAHLQALARDTHGHLTAARDRFFGERRTEYLDAECLRPDGTWDAARLAGVLRGAAGGGERTEDLGLWAARRFAGGPGTAHERLMLFLTVCHSLDLAHPDPPPSVYRELRPVLESAVTAVPEKCPHGDAHPGAGAGLPGEAGEHLAHLCAPESFPAPEGAREPDAWACPRNLAPLAEEWLEWCDTWDEAAEDGYGEDDD
ncbi:hypothetical protein TPA0598_08_03830 [Streptomyces lydicamycinicus]|uniref:Uncharacterized protein n=1 Tax=Streptomyces lydicamycinicus TaxID=1546107 RepID=A0A0P4RF14_9ACTN|nr:hypothetical protein [Streptomyces lydicamycinicus]GAO11472.1 hypothetical protein TPA0598_08_03830 [Streptomyces lydicamycinicus]